MKKQNESRLIIIGDESKMRFIDKDGEVYQVYGLPLNLDDLVIGDWYIVGDSIYKYIGEVTGDIKKGIPEGSLAKYINRFMINRYENEKDREFYSINHVEFLSKLQNDSSYSAILSNYAKKFSSGQILIQNIGTKVKNSGEVYAPEVSPDDDILTRMMKLIINDIGVVLSSYKTDCENSYYIDNLRSGLNGATHTTTITKFLDWCELLELDWSFSIFDDELVDAPNPLGKRLTVSKGEDLWIECGEPERGVFKVPLVKGEDPLKRLIKVAVIMKRVVPAEYKEKGYSKHLFNNMMSSLKRPEGRMMITYFIYWCEILGLNYEFIIKDKNGHERRGNRLID